jgi:hypothetical protein
MAGIMHNRGFIFWGVGLITAGAIALSVQQRWLDEELFSDAWRFWPMILVAIGLSIAVARTRFAVVGTLVAGLTAGVIAGAVLTAGPVSFGCGGSAPTNTSTEEGVFGSSPTVRLDFTCGRLDVAMTSDAGWTVESAWSQGVPPPIESDAGSLEVRSADTTGFMQVSRQRWDVTLPDQARYDLVRIDANAAESTLDLAGARIDTLRIGINAGSLVMTLDGGFVDDIDLGVNAGSASVILEGPTQFAGTLHVNAGSIEMCTTHDVALRITLTDANAFGDNLADSGLERSGDTWSTSGWADADLLVTVTVSGNAGSFDLNPEGGCS